MFLVETADFITPIQTLNKVLEEKLYLTTSIANIFVFIGGS